MKLHRSIPIALALSLVAAGSAHAATASGLDKQYLTTSIQGDRFEIAGGKLAQAKSQNAQVRALGARLVADHTKSLHEATRMAHALGVHVPSAPTPSQRWELQIVGSLSGQALDQWYARLEVADHHQDISEAGDEVTDGANHQVRHSAQQEIPTLRKHLKLAQAALKAVS
jgi:putative membrane protein